MYVRISDTFNEENRRPSSDRSCARILLYLLKFNFYQSNIVMSHTTSHIIDIICIDDQTSFCPVVIAPHTVSPLNFFCFLDFT